jgi:hypothetical protein
MSLVKDAYDIRKDVAAGVAKAEEQKRKDEFECGKQEFMMVIVTAQRTHGVTVLGFPAPPPGTLEFADCEALVADGFLERNILEGKYFTKSPYGFDGNSLY